PTRRSLLSFPTRRSSDLAGVWFRLHQVLLAKLDDADLIDWARAAIDASFARAFGGVEGSGPNPTDRGRPGVKHHALVDAQGIPLDRKSTRSELQSLAYLV